MKVIDARFSVRDATAIFANIQVAHPRALAWGRP